MVNVVEPLTVPDVALISVCPAPVALATPVVLIDATPVADELQVTEFVRFAVLPLPNWPVATNCCTVPVAVEGLVGVIAIDFRPLTLPVPFRFTTLGLPKA